jgi:hypothetical protein
MDVIPEMSVFMTNLTSCKTPQKTISLLQSEARDWEGTFSPGAMHKKLLSKDSFHRKQIEQILADSLFSAFIPRR